MFGSVWNSLHVWCRMEVKTTSFLLWKTHKLQQGLPWKLVNSFSPCTQNTPQRSSLIQLIVQPFHQLTWLCDDTDVFFKPINCNFSIVKSHFNAMLDKEPASLFANVDVFCWIHLSWAVYLTFRHLWHCRVGTTNFTLPFNTTFKWGTSQSQLTEKKNTNLMAGQTT